MAAISMSLSWTSSTLANEICSLSAWMQLFYEAGQYSDRMAADFNSEIIHSAGELPDG